MKRLLFSAAAVALFAVADSASANHPPVGSHVGGPVYGGPAFNGYPGAGCAGGDCGGAWGGPASPYGWNPIWRGWRSGKHGCNGCAGYGAGGYGGPPVQGTLVFPKHPFARSPRDFFMID